MEVEGQASKEEGEAPGWIKGDAWMGKENAQRTNEDAQEKFPFRFGHNDELAVRDVEHFVVRRVREENEKQAREDAKKRIHEKALAKSASGGSSASGPITKIEKAGGIVASDALNNFEEDMAPEDVSSVCSDDLDQFIDDCVPALVEKKRNKLDDE